MIETNHKAMEELIRALAQRFGRPPTKDEVRDFIFGDDDTRQLVWNKELSPDPNWVVPEDQLALTLATLVRAIENGDR